MSESSTTESLIYKIAKEEFAKISGVEINFVVGKEDHPLRTTQKDKYRLVVLGWSVTYHQCFDHIFIKSTRSRFHQVDPDFIRNQIEPLVKRQRKRSEEGFANFSRTVPFERYPFSQDNEKLELGHIKTNTVLLRYLMAAEGLEETKRIISGYLNCELYRREMNVKYAMRESSLRGSVLAIRHRVREDFSIENGRLYLRANLPETVMSNLKNKTGIRLGEVITCPGIDDLKIKHVFLLVPNNQTSLIEKANIAIELDVDPISLYPGTGNAN